ncbi:hypothetical protein [Bacteroides thetaiotaomicron]|nr:hypothetical protein [Bacteroides thetaiotaomicron]MDC2233564.1 hypothetical protein [Bacteroides thetaiotaomicron]
MKKIQGLVQNKKEKNIMAKVFITRYALTSGIKEVETEIHKSNFKDSPNYVRDSAYSFYYIGKDAFLDKSEALNKAEDMRKKKIASLRKQIEKLEKMEF